MKQKTRHNQKRQDIELLAPAGSLDTCRAVINAGADAVYLGGARFGARAYADNFTQDELLGAIDYAHLHGRKIFLTVNTLLKQKELADELYPYLLPYYEAGLDAVIVQDFGVLQLVHDLFPGLAIHASTQMSVADKSGAAYLYAHGASRIVTARELSFAEISDIRAHVPVEIESFIHGALCYCYSGQCLFSSMLGGRSGNRGRCAQPCRLPYTVLDENGRQIAQADSYPLSPKDLCTVDMIPQLSEAGVYSFKIEGRMKSAEYAAGVVSVYRKYIDRFLQGNGADVSRQDYQKLLDTGNRSGFTKGYYVQHNGPDMITMKSPGHSKNNEALKSSVHAQYVVAEQKIPVRAEAFFKVGEPAMLTVYADHAQGFAQAGVVEAAKKQPMSREMLAAQLAKTGGTPFTFASVDIALEDAVFLPKQTVNALRREALDELRTALLQPQRKSAPYSVAEASEKIAAFCAGGKTDAQNGHTLFFTAVAERSEQLAPIISCGYVGRVYLDSALFTHAQLPEQLSRCVRRLHDAGIQAYLMMPYVFRMETARFYEQNWEQLLATGVDGFLVKTTDELGFFASHHAFERCVLDHSLYAYSDYTKNAYRRAGWERDTVPLELNRAEIFARDNSSSELVVYGRAALMASAQCVHKNMEQCDHVRTVRLLKDRYAKEFPVKNNCSECYNTIYNAQPLSLLKLADELKKTGVCAYRLHFTVEDGTLAGKILACCRQAFFEGKTPDMEAVAGAYTNGHYKRGVE